MKLRLTVAATALAIGAAPFATTPATAMACHPDFQIVCTVLGTACRTIDNPKFGCPQLG